MMKLIKFIKKKKCTKTVLGEIVDMYSLGKNFPTVLYVEYPVGDRNYTRKEELKLKTIRVRTEKNTVEEREMPSIGRHKIGDLIHVCYNPNKPSMSYIEYNDGY